MYVEYHIIILLGKKQLFSFLYHQFNFFLMTVVSVSFLTCQETHDRGD